MSAPRTLLRSLSLAPHASRRAPSTLLRLQYRAALRCPTFASATPLARRTMATSTDPAAGGAIASDADANTSGVTGQELEAKLRETVGAVHVEVQDISGGCGQSFAATIVSPLFEKKMTLARHRLVNGALRDEIGRIHAWTPKCFTPAEWETKKAA